MGTGLITQKGRTSGDRLCPRRGLVPPSALSGLVVFCGISGRTPRAPSRLELAIFDCRLPITPSASSGRSRFGQGCGVWGRAPTRLELTIFDCRLPITPSASSGGSRSGQGCGVWGRAPRSAASGLVVFCGISVRTPRAPTRLELTIFDCRLPITPSASSGRSPSGQGWGISGRTPRSPTRLELTIFDFRLPITSSASSGRAKSGTPPHFPCGRCERSRHGWKIGRRPHFCRVDCRPGSFGADANTIAHRRLDS